MNSRMLAHQTLRRVLENLTMTERYKTAALHCPSTPPVVPQLAVISIYDGSLMRPHTCSCVSVDVTLVQHCRGQLCAVACYLQPTALILTKDAVCQGDCGLFSNCHTVHLIVTHDTLSDIRVCLMTIKSLKRIVTHSRRCDRSMDLAYHVFPHEL